MSPLGLSPLLALAALSLVSAQDSFPKTPLANKHFTYPNLSYAIQPYRVDTDDNLLRGPQLGYNQCNSTTEGKNSLCQTSFLNSLDDFCVWAPSQPNSAVADQEGHMVAWCTKPGRGTRVIPAGALTGVQFIKTPAYVSVVGFIDQTKINIAAGDSGGEMDPHGADLRGNPLGGLVFSNAFGGDKNTFTQAIEWHNFMGSNSFCFKACDPANKDAAHFCEHVFDRIGCAYNVPSNAQNGVFESCLGDNQDFPGVYTVNGQVMTYTQPPEDQGAIQTMPYTARVPASSSCVAFKSADVFNGGVGVPVASPSASSAVSSASSTISSSGSATPSVTRSSSASGSASISTASSSPRTTASAASSTTGTSGNPQSTSNDAVTLAISGASILGIVFSALFLS
ncbi:hypothetical protein BDQ12DRAFT_668743 [Crucibulum laeve]|uniref:Macrofage activating glycoprotein n=1 Tax=Crucibulum laeve TaxID=68775 RepID=A0A5C3LR80_9AGAR|nr:hypothetical protein BDQ12DRAFT_668743 [Crucibulum laeve]